MQIDETSVEPEGTGLMPLLAAVAGGLRETC